MNVRVNSPRWMTTLGGPGDAPLTLLCLPYAGGGAGIFKGWAEHLGHAVRVVAAQLPGRGERRGELPFTRMGSLVDVLGRGLVSAGLFDKPVAIFGHSMGSLIAFELCRWLRAEHNFQPRLLCVAGRGAPEIPDPGLALHAASEAALVAELRRLGGTTEQIFADPARRQSLLRLIRADFAVCEMYDYIPAPPLECPIVAFGGADDPDWRAEQLATWCKETSAGCEVHILPGGHFFIDTARHEFLARLADSLQSVNAD